MPTALSHTYLVLDPLWLLAANSKLPDPLRLLLTSSEFPGVWLHCMLPPSELC